MKRMWSKNELKKIIHDLVESTDWEFDGDISIGGDVSIGGDLSVTGSINGEENPSVKPVYWHTISFQRGGTAETSTVSRFYGQMIILNNSPTPITLQDFQSLLATDGFVGVVINGEVGYGASDLTNFPAHATKIVNTSPTTLSVFGRDKTTNVEQEYAGGVNITTGWVVFEDLGANKIN